MSDSIKEVMEVLQFGDRVYRADGAMLQKVPGQSLRFHSPSRRVVRVVSAEELLQMLATEVWGIDEPIPASVFILTAYGTFEERASGSIIHSSAIRQGNAFASLEAAKEEKKRRDREYGDGGLRF
jgi:hypothetical protein